MNLSIVNIKKSQLDKASKDASTATMEAPAKKQVKNVKPDYTGVPEAEADAKAIKSQKKSATSKTRTERKVVQKKTVAPKAEVKAPIKAKEEPKPKKEKEQAKLTLKKFSLIHYSEKSIALFGDTKPIKEDLKALGGRYNANLHPFGEESRVPGWVFPKKCEDAVRELVNL